MLKSGETQPLFGVVWLQNHVETDQGARTVHILGVQITRTRFPNPDSAAEQAVAWAQEVALAMLQVRAVA